MLRMGPPLGVIVYESSLVQYIIIPPLLKCVLCTHYTRPTARHLRTLPRRTNSLMNTLALLPEQEILEFLGVLELLQKGFDILPTRTGVGPRCTRIAGFDVL